MKGVIYQEYIKTRVISFKFVNKYYYSTALDPSQRTGTLLVKGKGLPRSCRTPPTHARESGVLHGPSGTTHSLGKACCLAFSLSCGTVVEQTDHWRTAPRPQPGWKTETRGRSSCSTEAKKFGVRRVFLIEQEHSVLVLLLLVPSSYSLLYYQYYHYTTSRYMRGTTSQEQKMGRSCFG